MEKHDQNIVYEFNKKIQFFLSSQIGLPNSGLPFHTSLVILRQSALALSHM